MTIVSRVFVFPCDSLDVSSDELSHFVGRGFETRTMGAKASKVHMLFDEGKKEVALRMIEEGVVEVDACDRSKFTLLHKALGDSDTIRRLIAAGADPNAQVRDAQ